MTPDRTPDDEHGPTYDTNPGIAPAPESVTTLRLEQHPPFPETRTAPPGTLKYWAAGALALALLGGSLGYYLLYPSGDAPASFRSAEALPPVLQPYMEGALRGDPSAMRMLGTMYYNGLNVKQNRKEGIKWYRKAAAAGSVAAKKDLEQLGLSGEGNP